MRIIEVRDGFIKFEAEKAPELSTFVRVSYFEKNYIAQVVQIKNAGSVYNVYAKLVYLYDGLVTPYDGSLPSRDALLEEFSFAEVNEGFNIKMPIVPCEFIGGETLKADADFMDSLFICSDKPDYINGIVSNLSKQLLNTIIIDMQGTLSREAVVAGNDFRLPLNSETLDFMYEDCLNDATAASKSVVKEIFDDLSAYSKTVDFLPFSALKTIVDDMVDNSHIFSLLVLKNKLQKFDRAGYFASLKEDADKLEDLIKAGNITIDLSKLDAIFRNRYLETILSCIEKNSEKVKVFINASNDISKKNLKSIILNENVNPVLITGTRFKYTNEIKSMYKNFMLESSFVLGEIFKPFKNMLSSMPDGTLLFIGEATDRLPLIIKTGELENLSPADYSAKIVSSAGDGDITEENIAENLTEEELADLSPEEQAVVNKSDELMSKISEEIESSEPINEDLFGSDETQEENEEAEDIAFSEMTEFHTNVTESAAPETLNDVYTDLTEDSDDATQSVETPDVLSLDDENAENIEEAEQIEVDEDLIEDIETDINEEIPQDTDALPLEEVNGLEEIQETAEAELPKEEIIPEAEELSDEEATLSNEEEIPMSGDSEDDDSAFDEIVELDENEISDNDIVVDLTDGEMLDGISDDVDKEITEDVDKVFTTMKEDTISDDDLDFIDELNNDLNSDEEISINEGEGIEPLEDFNQDGDEDGFLEPLEEVNDTPKDVQEEREILETKNSTTPIVPVYDADIPQEDIVMSDPIEQGDTVVHAKFGTGVVEKMIKYGSKNLYSINFDNVKMALLLWERLQKTGQT